MTNHQLTVIDGRLYFPVGGNDDDFNPDPSKPSLLIRYYEAGDCDTIPWPLRGEDDKARLARALYDERETNNQFKYGDTVETPDGAAFRFE